MRALVVGTGRAGLSRLAAISRRDDISAESLSYRAHDFEERLTSYLQDPQIEAVLVCTANSTHFEIASAALTAKKHVLVEFPLVHDIDQAQKLYGLSQEHQRVLHVEFIGLMTADHLGYIGMERSSWKRVCVSMVGGFYRWIRTDYENGQVGNLLVGRLQALHHLLGDLELIGVHLDPLVDGYKLFVRLQNREGIQIELTDHRSVGAERKRSMEIYNQAGEIVVPSQRRQGHRLFDEDLDVFVNKINHSPYEWSLPSDADILEVIKLSMSISKQGMCTKGSDGHQGF